LDGRHNPTRLNDYSTDEISDVTEGDRNKASKDGISFDFGELQRQTDRVQYYDVSRPAISCTRTIVEMSNMFLECI